MEFPHYMTGGKDPKRQLQGAVSRAAGKRFEERLDAAFRYYAETGAALVEKTPEPMRPCQSVGDGKFVAFFEKKAQPDYKGTLAGGRAFLMEAKYTASDTMESGRVQPGQAKSLAAHQRLGALCCVAVGFSSGGVYLIPWTVWTGMKACFGRKYVKETDLQNYKVPNGRGGIPLLLDALEGSLL